MPKRTTDRQRAIYLLRKAIAPEGWEVEESAELHDPILGDTREVDVVVRGKVNELDVVIGFEVIDRGRAADVSWVESMLAKHEHLPTNKIVLVSWRGFTKGAKVKASSRPDVVLMAPMPVNRGDPRTMTLYADEITFTIERITVEVETPAGELRRVRIDPDHEFRDLDGNGIAALDLIMKMIEEHEVPQEMLQVAHNSEARDELKFFEFGWIAGDDLALHLFDTAAQELHRVVSGKITGPFTWSQTPVDLRIESFKDAAFGHGRITLNGRDGHMVLTLQDGEPRGRGAIELSTAPTEDHDRDSG